MKHRHRIVFALAVGGLALVLGEAFIWLASPSEYLYPRYQFSAGYGLVPFPNVTMVHGIPRRFQYRYTVGADGCRGEVPDPGDARHPVVVTLGDSYTFGMGVSDGEEYPAVMQRFLGETASVVNLGGPGWGLTQEVRRFVELGEAYDPEIVVLQFCANDPEDNLTNRVSLVENGELVFVPSENSLNVIKKYLSRSFLQRTQIYNFMRTRASRALLARLARREEARLAPQPAPGAGREATSLEQVYIDLLEVFCERVCSSGRRLILISVDHQLDQFPGIARAVRDLDDRGRLQYVDMLEFLRGSEPYASPEGHIWGTRAHAIVGEALAGEVAGIVAHPDSGADCAQQ